VTPFGAVGDGYTTRPLPRPVTPLPGETLRSYLGRLADANMTDEDTVRALVYGHHRKTATPRLAVLTRLSGQSGHTLARALPELAPAG
jgi:hypothetical protein